MDNLILFKNANISFTDEGKGTAVILLHGFLENKNMWKEIKPSLLKQNRIISIDLLGHGNSDCIGYVHSMELFAEAVEKVIHHLKIRKYILIGHSLGGYVALALADKYPLKIKGICLMNSTSNSDSEERKELRTRANKMIVKNFESMVKMSVANLFLQKNTLKFKEEIEDIKQQALKTPLQGYLAAQEGMKARKNRNSVLLNNNFQKLLVIGENDPVLSYDSSISEAQNTNSNHVVLSGGHMSHIENKNELIIALEQFVKSC